jgi:HK97 family phage portal protein
MPASFAIPRAFSDSLASVFSSLRFWEKKAATRTVSAGERLPGSLPSAGWSVFGAGSWAFSNGAANRGGGRPDYSESAGDLCHNSATSNCLSWVAKNWPQAQATVVRLDADGKPETVDHPLPALLRRPSPLYNGRILMQAMLRDYYGYGRGNAYAYIVLGNGGNGDPIELQWLPSSTMKACVHDDGPPYFEYRPRGWAGDPYRLPIERVLHLRNGMRAENPLIGVDPLQAIVPEVATDNEAVAWQYKLLKKGAVPPWLIGPKGKEDGAYASFSQEEGDFFKKAAGEKIYEGEGLVLPAAFELIKLGWDPKSMVVGETQRKSEERIAGAFGLPAVVAQLGAGLDRSTFNNYEEARQAGWEDCIIPLQDEFADEVTAKLLPLFAASGKDSTDLIVAYDRSRVRALQDDESAKATDAANLFDKEVIDRASAKRRIGEKPLPEDEGLYKSDATAAPAPEPGAAGTTPLPAPAKSRRFKKKEATLESVAADFRARLLAHEAEAVAAVHDALEPGERRLRADLESLIERMTAAAEAGEDIAPSWLEAEKRFRALIDQVEMVYRDLADGATEALTATQRVQVTVAVESARSLTEAAAGPAPAEVPGGVVTSWHTLPQPTLETLVGYAADGSPLADVLAAIGPDAGKAVREALFAGVLNGWNPRETARQMRDGMDAKLALSRARAETIARTETLRAAREASRRTYEANSDVVDGWVWLCSLGTRTCAACWAMHGTFHGLGQTLDDHPNGRCVAVPRTKSWAQITGDATLPDTRPTVETGAAVFERLPAEQQQAVLGEALHALLEAGDVTLADCVTQTSDPRWGTMRRAATVAEAQANARRRQG